MVYDCKIYDKNGKLKKVHRSEDLEKKREDAFYGQKTTQTAIKTVRGFKQGPAYKKVGAFHEKKCLYCKALFHARQRTTKYCTQECQKAYYKYKRKQGSPKK